MNLKRKAKPHFCGRKSLKKFTYPPPAILRIQGGIVFGYQYTPKAFNLETLAPAFIKRFNESSHLIALGFSHRETVCATFAGKIQDLPEAFEQFKTQFPEDIPDLEFVIRNL